MVIVKFYSDSMAGHTPDTAILREDHRPSVGELLGVFFFTDSDNGQTLLARTKVVDFETTVVAQE